MNGLKRNSLAIATVAMMSLPSWANAATLSEAASDAWIDGSVETALLFSSHLNNFEIDTQVKDGVVTLSGAVESDIDRDLAGEIAKGVHGVKSVDNRLAVDGKISTLSNVKAKTAAGARGFKQWFDDATTTAEIKSKLLANRNTQGLKIDVSTQGDVVVLEGAVRSDEELALAERIAANVDGVDRVDNRLTVAAR